MSNATTSKDVLSEPVAGNHFVQVYQDSDTLAGAVCHFIQHQLRPDEAVVVIACASHLAGIKTRLLSQGIDLEHVVQSGQYRFFDAESLLPTLMTDGGLDKKKADTFLSGLLAEVFAGHSAARAYGELVDILWQQGKKDDAVALENCWNELLGQHAFSLLCAYHVDNLDPAVYEADIECLCSTHTHFLPSQDFNLLEQALAKASENVMGVSLSGMMKSIAKFPHPTTIMPAAQASLLYISKTMPVTTEFILKQVRQNLALAKKA